MSGLDNVIRAANDHAKDGPAEPGSMLRVRDVTVRFGGFTALDSVSFAVPAGGVVGIIGPNGAGKSTLVDAVCGFIRPTRGSVSLGATEMRQERPSSRAKLGLVRTFQTPRLFDSLAVAEHLQLVQADRFRGAFGLAPHSRHLLERLGLLDQAQERAQALAGGQRKLLDVARAFAQQSLVTVLDEPVAGVAHHHHDAVAEIIRDVVADGTHSVVLVEHNIPFVEAVCDSVVVLDFGRVIANGLWAEVKRNPSVVEAYLGRDGVKAAAQ